jgi:hypothetical protein
MDIKKRRMNGEDEDNQYKKIDLNYVYNELTTELNLLKIKNNKIEDYLVEKEENDLKRIKMEKDLMKMNQTINQMNEKMDKLFGIIEDMNKKMFDKINELTMENGDLKRQIELMKEEKEYFEEKEKKEKDDKKENKDNYKDNFSFYS